jgi:hypothetical protein
VRKLGVLGIGLVGLAFLLNSIGAIWLPFTVFTSDLGRFPKSLAAVLFTLPFLTTVAAGLFLLLRRERLATRWFPQSESPLTLAAEDLARVGIVLIGLYVLVNAIPTLISLVVAPIVWTSSAAGQADAEFGGPTVLAQVVGSIPRYLGTSASFVVGWAMIAQSERLTARLMRIRRPTAEREQASFESCSSCGAPYDPADYVGGIAEPRCSQCKEPLGIPRTGQETPDDEGRSGR